MSTLPRLALATPATGSEPSYASLAWLAGLTSKRWRIQHFRSHACPTATEAVGQVTGLPGRHLDSWLMPDPVLRTLFARGAQRADLALVEGTLEGIETLPIERAACDLPGRLSPIVEALDLPVVAVVSCTRGEDFHLPRIPIDVDAIFLDGLENPADFECYRRMVNLATRKPVVGALEAMPAVRQALLEAPRDQPIAEELVAALGASFLRFADLPAIKALAGARSWTGGERMSFACSARRFRVAYAQDEAFGAYFPDTLEALESMGAELVEFSPIRDEALPDHASLVMIGCGYPDLHADALAENLSMIAALRSHVCRGQRIYSEGGGTAYLGRSMVIGDRRIPGAGILPFHAELLPNPVPPFPVTRTLTRDCWLGPRGSVVRGYKASRWQLMPGVDPLDCPSCFGSLTAEEDVFFHHHAIGGLIHLHLAARPEAVAAFAGPHPPSLTLPSARPCR
jgi:cobyrinic acid a,c-diamide synthase